MSTFKVGDFARVVGGDHHGEIARIVPIRDEHAGWARVAYMPSGGGLCHSADPGRLEPVVVCASCGGDGFVSPSP